MFDYQVDKDSSEVHVVNPAVIKVVGCGGGGGNAVNTMIEANVQGVEFIALNTDGQDLLKSKAPTKIQIGKKFAGGLGAGGNPSVGEDAAKESESEIKEILNGANMVFITAGMGGGTGTGSAPVVAKVAHDLGALTVAVVTYPFSWENQIRSKNADLGIEKLKKEVDSLIVVPNDKIYEMRVDPPVKVAFAAVTDILRQGVQGITDIIMRPGLVNRDFRDVESIMKGQGQALLGIGIGAGENRAIDAATDAINNPLLEDTHIDGARNILINVCGGDDVRMSECREIATFITSRASEGANVIWGLVIDENMEDKLSVTVIATGFESENPKQIQSSPVQEKKRSDDNVFNEDEFVKISTTRPVAQSVMQPRPVQPQTQTQQPIQTQKTTSKTRVNVGEVLGGSPIYEDNEAQAVHASQPHVQQTVPQVPVSEVIIPKDYVDDQNDITKPAIAREMSKLNGLSRGINLGS